MAKRKLDEYCRAEYKRIYNKEYKTNLGSRSSDSAKDKAEKKAQKEAMQKTLVNGIKNYGADFSVHEIWGEIKKAHIARKLGTQYGKRVKLDLTLTEAIFSVYQSWVKSSGHAFEEYIPNVLNALLKPYYIKILLQKELTEIIDSIGNNPDQKNWLKEQISASVFDLYAVYQINNEDYVIGCIQSKTSIRERVGTNTLPSQLAMDMGFWSVGVVLNGDFLTKKFQNMVNGGPGYPKIGWHGLYVYDSEVFEKRIYHFDDIVEHARKAAKTWVAAPTTLNDSWDAEKIKL